MEFVPIGTLFEARSQLGSSQRQTVIVIHRNHTRAFARRLGLPIPIFRSNGTVIDRGDHETPDICRCSSTGRPPSGPNTGMTSIKRALIEFLPKTLNTGRSSWFQTSFPAFARWRGNHDAGVDHLVSIRYLLSKQHRN